MAAGPERRDHDQAGQHQDSEGHQDAHDKECWGTREVRGQRSNRETMKRGRGGSLLLTWHPPTMHIGVQVLEATCGVKSN